MAYATVEDVRATGVTEIQASNETLENLLDEQSAKIDLYTGQFFEPRPGPFFYDGHSHQTLNTHIPIIELTGVRVRNSGETGAPPDEFTSIALEDISVYNRDGQFGQVTSGDEGSPRIRLQTDTFFSLSSGTIVFPQGSQNIRLDGTFGRTEPVRAYIDTSLETFVLLVGDTLEIELDDSETIVVVTFEAGDFPDFNIVTAEQLSVVLSADVTGLKVRSRYSGIGKVARFQSEQKSFSSRVQVIGGTAAAKLGLDTALEVFFPYGRTPLAIRDATIRLVRTALGLSASSVLPVDPSDPGAIKRHRTRSQEVDFAVGSGTSNQHLQRGSLTGDPVVDVTLARYRRPIRVAVPRSLPRARAFW